MASVPTVRVSEQDSEPESRKERPEVKGGSLLSVPSPVRSNIGINNPASGGLFPLPNSQQVAGGSAPKGGNLGFTFKIEPQTGFIRVNKPLDFENINEYTLVVTALDGQYSNDTTVHIKVLNRNDMKPEFMQDVYTTNLKEEERSSVNGRL